MLQRRSAIDLLRVGLFVRVQHEIDRRVADGVRGHAPVVAVQVADHGDEAFGGDGLQAAERAPFVPRLLVGVAHQAALESAVNGELDAADAQPLVAFTLPEAG